MNEYEKIALATRRKISRLTLQQQNELLRIYESAIENLSSKITTSKDKSLSQRWLTDYRKELKAARNNLAKELNKSIRGYTTKAARIGTETDQQILSKMFEYAGLDVGPHFSTMFSQVQKSVLNDIISGSLYKDSKTLSSRIWTIADKTDNDIQYIINRGILEKKSALELAKDLEKFVDEPSKRSWNWGKVYPNLMGTKIDYNSQRLARTSINHAYQTSTVQSAGINPFVEAIKWHSAEIHGRTCDLCISRANDDEYGLGAGIFPKDQIPLDHPQGLCFLTSVIPKSLDEVADILKNWVDGGSNKMLDDWYEEYGEMFATRTI